MIWSWRLLHNSNLMLITSSWFEPWMRNWSWWSFSHSFVLIGLLFVRTSAGNWTRGPSFPFPPSVWSRLFFFFGIPENLFVVDFFCWTFNIRIFLKDFFVSSCEFLRTNDILGKFSKPTSSCPLLGFSAAFDYKKKLGVESNNIGWVEVEKLIATYSVMIFTYQHLSW